MANYKTIKQLRAELQSLAYSFGCKKGMAAYDGKYVTDMVEAGIRLGAAAEQRAIYAHIMKSTYANGTGDMAASEILNFIQGRKKRTEKAAGGWGS